VRLRCLSMKMFRFEKKKSIFTKGAPSPGIRPRLTKYEDYIHCACYSWPNFNHWRWNFLSQWRKILSSGKVLCPFWNMLCKVISNSLSNINWYHTNGTYVYFFPFLHFSTICVYDQPDPDRFTKDFVGISALGESQFSDNVEEDERRR